MLSIDEIEEVYVYHGGHIVDNFLPRREGRNVLPPSMSSYDARRVKSSDFDGAGGEAINKTAMTIASGFETGSEEFYKAYVDLLDFISLYSSTGSNSAPWVLSRFLTSITHEGIQRYHFLGSGCYGLAFEDTIEGTVVKVSSGREYTRDSYFPYIESVKGIDNPFFPKVDSVVIGKLSGLAVMEKLTESETLEKLNVISCSNGPNWNLGNLAKYLEYTDEIEQNSEHFQELLQYCLSKSMFSTDTLTDYIIDATRHLRSIQLNTNGFIDLHSGNVMYRGSFPIITDPIAGGRNYLTSVRDIMDLIDQIEI